MFAAIAVGLHIALLLVPINQQDKGRETAVIDLHLLASPQSPVEQIQLIEPEPLEPVKPPPPETDLAQHDLPLPEPHEKSPQNPPAPVTAAFLLEQVSALILPEPVQKTRKLGIASIRALPANWTEPLLPAFSGPFQESFAPIENKILDQWIQPDGMRHVVMRTPGGHALCGSLEQWSPINPLYEPVPMYRLCGGGGRRKAR